MRTLTFPQESPVPSIWDRHSDARRRSCMLLVTHSCNLNCSYCYESHKDDQMMSQATARGIVQKELEMIRGNPDFDELLVDFMGGEPLLNFPLIKGIVEWLEKEYPSAPWLCYATTNATLLSQERQEWFRRHRTSIVLGGSYDGSPEMQKTNRGEAAGAADLKFIHSCWPYQPFRMTIAKESLPHLADELIEMQRKGYLFEAALAQGVDWTMSDAKLYLEQLRMLKNAYLADESLQPINIMTKPLSFIEKSTPELPQTKFCGTGTNMVTYDVDGTAYGCHMFTPIVLGRDHALRLNAIDWKNAKIAEDEHCRKCILKCWCPTCMGFNYRYRGNVAARDRRWCHMILAEALAVCEFQVEYLADKHKIWQKRDGQYALYALEAYEVLKNHCLEKSAAPFKICPDHRKKGGETNGNQGEEN